VLVVEERQVLVDRHLQPSCRNTGGEIEQLLEIDTLGEFAV
jgi:hypothetical protein